MPNLAATVQSNDIHLIMRPQRYLPLIFIVSFFSSAHAVSCSCIHEQGSLEEQVTAAFSSASNVLWAKAESTQEMSFGQQGSNTSQTKKNSNPGQMQRTQFVAVESWKGSHPKRFSTEVALVCCVCGYRFVKDKEYLLYLHSGPNEDGYYRASVCTRTKPINSTTKQEIEVLRELSLAHEEKKRTPTCHGTR